MSAWFKRTFFAVLLLLVGYVLAVQVLRWIAFGEEEKAALALMAPPPSPPAGESGYKYLGFTQLRIPPDELDAALATDLAAYREWHARGAERLGAKGQVTAPYRSPLEDRYPARPPMADAPEGACQTGDLHCLDKMRGHEVEVGAWLAGEAERLDLAWRAVAADHLANPYPAAVDAPMAGFRALRLPINDVALQALQGDVPGALDRACRLMAAERRFLAQDTPLIDEMVHGAAAEGAADLVLALRRQDPAAPMPPSCTPALAPVEPEGFLVCGAFKFEHAMVATLSRQMQQRGEGSWRPGDWLGRLVLLDERLMRAWNAQQFVPFCSEAGQAAILAGRVPASRPVRTPVMSVDYWAAPISRILADLGTPDYERYQERLLDHAASLRLHLAAIAAVNGELPVGQVPATAASPGYTIEIEDGHWLLPRRRPGTPMGDTVRIPIPE